MIATRIKQMQPSPTIAVDTKAKQLKSQGIPVISLGLGEPDFDTPDNIKKAAVKAIENGFTHYTQTAGILPLREAITQKLKNDNNISYTPSQIITGPGSKLLLYNLFQVLCEKGDEVIIPLPTWSTYVEQVRLAEGVPVFIKLPPPFQLTAAQVKNTLTPKTKVLLLNSPSNPTGAMIDEKEMIRIADLAVKHKFFVIADEIYEKIIYDDSRHISIASLNDDIKKFTVTVNGVSKAYAMTGWRLGYAAGPQEIITAMDSLQSQMTSNASSISQMAALEAITGDQSKVTEMRDKFAERRTFLTEELSKIKGLSFTPPQGAFYFFVSVEKLLNKKYPDSNAWCAALLEQEKVAVVPGEAFYYPGYFRLSFASSMDDLQNAIEKIKLFVEFSK